MRVREKIPLFPNSECSANSVVVALHKGKYLLSELKLDLGVPVKCHRILFQEETIDLGIDSCYVNNGTTGQAWHDVARRPFADAVGL